MAEPREAPEAPRQNKTVKEFRGMQTQNQRNAIPEGSFGWLENIQPIGPGNLHSIPGRGLALVPIPAPGSCPDSVPQFQTLPIVCCYITDGFGELSPNCAGQMIHVADDGSFWATVSEMSGFASCFYHDQGSSSGPTFPNKTFYLLAADANSCNVVEQALVPF